MTDVVANLLFSILIFGLGLGAGCWLLEICRGSDDFRDKMPCSFWILALYGCLAVVLLHVPHLKIWPLVWRIQGLNFIWLIMRSLLLSACGLAIALCWRTSRNQAMAIALIGAIGFGGFWGLERYLMSPIYPSLDRMLTVHSVVQQTSDSSCAPAALATVLRQWNIDISEAEVAKLAQTSRMGTSMPHLIFAAQQLGMDGLDLEPSWQTIQQINRPGVLSVWVEEGDRRLPHALALLKMSHDEAVVADPALGKAFRIKRRDLEAMWRHDYVPIFRQTDVALSERQALEYLTRLSNAKRQADSWFIQAVSRGNILTRQLSDFQQQNRLKRSGKLDAATMLALQGPFIQDGPVLKAWMSDPMTLFDYHHVDS